MVCFANAALLGLDLLRERHNWIFFFCEVEANIIHFSFKIQAWRYLVQSVEKM